MLIGAPAGLAKSRTGARAALLEVSPAVSDAIELSWLRKSVWRFEVTRSQRVLTKIADKPTGVLRIEIQHLIAIPQMHAF